MFSTLTSAQKGILLGFTGYTAFSFSDVCSKWLTDSYSQYQIIILHSLVALIFLLLFSRLLGGMNTLKDTKNSKLHFIRMILNFLLVIVLFYCFSSFPLATIYTAVFLKPLFVVLIAIPLYHEKVTPHRWLSILAGLAGVLIAFQPWDSPLPLRSLLILFLLTGLISSVFLSVRSMKNPSPLSLCFYPVLGSLIFTAPLAYDNFTPIVTSDLPVFLAGGAFMAIGLLSISVAFQKAASSVVTPFMYTQMIWGLVFGYFLFSDTPDFWMMTGAGIIAASGVYLIRKEKVF